jgi:histidine ammonia-lyase
VDQAIDVDGLTGRSPAGSVLVQDDSLTAWDVVRVAAGAQVELSPRAAERISAGRAVVDRLVHGETLIYGLNTGLGHMRDVRVPLDTLRDYQVAIVRAHAGGLGEALPREIVRAAMFVRLVGIARGGSGATLGVARSLEAMLNEGVHPVVPVIGSVGASDLMHMAAIAQVLIGEGRAEHRGEVLPGGEALARAGIAAATLEPKDGLALVSANGVAVGHGALVAAAASRVAASADVIGALSLEAIRGNPSTVDPAVAAAKGIPGQIAVSRRIAALLEGSVLCSDGGPASVQDPLSFRVMPQVHGALQEFLDVAHRAIRLELSASDDNPFVSVAEDRMISNGNFHPIHLALAFDALRPALAHVGQISDRRTGHHWDRTVADPAAFEPARIERAISSGGLLLRYAGAARYAELRQLAQPATLDIGPLDLGVEDHATAAPLTVARTEDAVHRVADILAVELLTARMMLQEMDDARLGAGTARALAEIDAVMAGLPENRTASQIHQAAADLVLRGFDGIPSPS